MASTSSSSIPKSFKYDVFLSFRGEDTRKTFVDHLYYALHNRGITTYKDDEKIEKGKRIDDQLMRSIQDSRIYIIVFSKNYASSSWCLDELVKIMECHRTTGQTAYPVFFNVEPTEVRHQSGAVGDAFAKHEKEEAAGIWRNAMKEAADLAGRELKTTFDGHEARFIQKIVEDISLELRFIDFSVDEKLIGMETRVKDVVSYIEDASVGVHMIGIKGIGGGGKTTLATAVFNHISDSFEGKSFVENVREVSKGSGLKELQKQVLNDVLNDKSIDITSVYEGKNMMKRMMCCRKVLVVLDDVDDMEQLEALAGEHTWFKSGSTIIITTRDEEVLVAHRVKFIHDVNLLSDEEGIRLFSKYAFGREIPIEGYEELSRKVVHYAAGLPLTIKVLGSSLCGKTQCEWNEAIERLETIPEKQTLKRLELSYISLEHDHKEVFLEVACILKGESKDKAIKILESCGFHARFALKVLEQKSLITISYSDRLNMHDRIEEMGRNIVRRLHPHEPQKHSRLWVEEEIENILVNELGTKATLSIKMLYVNLHPAIIMKGLRKMKKLRLLYVDGVDYVDDVDEGGWYLPSTLQSLKWKSYPLRCLPQTFQANKLVNLEIRGSGSISQLWEGGERKVLHKLRFVLLSGSYLRTFDLGMTPNLNTLNLKGCEELEELQIPVVCSKLKAIYLQGSKLSYLNLGMIPHIETLFLLECSSLQKVNAPTGCLKKLVCLELRNCSRFINFVFYKMKKFFVAKLELKAESLDTCPLHPNSNLPKFQFQCRYDEPLSSSSGNVEMLLSFGLCACTNLDAFSASIRGLQHLGELTLKGGFPELPKDLYELPKDLYGLGSLEKLNLSMEDIKHLPDSICVLKNLKYLNLGRCLLLEQLPKDLGRLECLEELDLRYCESLRDIPSSIYNMKRLERLNLQNCIRVEKLPEELGRLKCLKELGLGGCKDFVELHMSIECPKLKSLNLSGSKVSNLNLGLTPNLETLDLGGCSDFLEVHMPIKCAPLKFLNLCGSKVSNLNLGLTPNLETLDLGGCSDFLEVHMPIECAHLKFLNLCGSKVSNLNLGLTPHLERLDLKECHYLHEICAPMGCLKQLVYLNISGCSRFECFAVSKQYELPGINHLASLQLFAESVDICPLHPNNSFPKFQFECFYDEPLPSSSGNLEKLLSFGLCACTNLESFSASICGLQRLRKLTLEGSIPEAPKDLYRLESLEELTLCMKEIRHLPDSICMLKHLKSLKLRYCQLLEQLPKDLGRLEALEELHLTDCISLREIPNRICDMKRLKYLDLRFCILVEKLPEEFGRLESLEELNIEGAGISRLPHSIFELKGLYIVGSRWRLESYGFTSLNEISTYTASCYIRDSQHESPL